MEILANTHAISIQAWSCSLVSQSDFSQVVGKNSQAGWDFSIPKTDTSDSHHMCCYLKLASRTDPDATNCRTGVR
jgi:hypothetical protein